MFAPDEPIDPQGLQAAGHTAPGSPCPGPAHDMILCALEEPPSPARGTAPRPCQAEDPGTQSELPTSRQPQVSQ